MKNGGQELVSIYKEIGNAGMETKEILGEGQSAEQVIGHCFAKIAEMESAQMDVIECLVEVAEVMQRFLGDDDMTKCAETVKNLLAWKPLVRALGE